MIRMSAKARIAMGMATLVVSVLMLADMLGMIPDPRVTAIQSRCEVSELVALQIRPVILQEDLVRIESILDAVVRRNDEILSGAVRRRDGKVVARFRTRVKPDAPEVIKAIEAELYKK